MLTLNPSARLHRSLATTNTAESLLSWTRHVKRNVKRWRSGQMMVAALRARDQQLGLSTQGPRNESRRWIA